VQGEEIVAAPEEAPKAQIIDLMEALKASLGGEEEKAERKPPKRAARKPAAKKNAAKRATAKKKSAAK
jgi:non-homologous end joining protein Ku